MKNYSTYTDEQLLLLLAGSDQEAFTGLYNRYHTGIYNYQLAFVKIPSIAEDLTQEVFLKIWEARSRLKIHTSFASYLFRISRNTAIDFMKKIAADRELRNEIILHQQSFFAGSGNNQLQAKEYNHLYKQAVDSLSQQRRTVFLLCREEGKTYQEVAGLLGISRHTVKEHMTKSLHSLRNFLSEKTESVLLLAILFRLL
ncbi:MAG: RNA polymerase sigma-70 factor [Chitinophagaceae bacterium]